MSRREQGLASATIEALYAIPTYTTGVHSLLRSLPTHFHRTGLAATVAYVASGTNRPGPVGAAYTAVAGLLLGRLKASKIAGSDRLRSLSGPETIRWLGGLSSRDYARLSADIGAALHWCKRLSEARQAQDQL